MKPQDEKNTARTDNKTTRNEQPAKPEANAKQDPRNTPTDKKAGKQEEPDTARTTMNAEKDRTDRKVAK